MTEMSLLPQDVYLLATRWFDPEHVSADSLVGPQQWRAHYRQRLERTIAQWLLKGLVAYQSPERRLDAFDPIANLIGTSPESLSYLDSLAAVCNALKSVKDPKYPPYPKQAFPETDVVYLGACFSNAVGLSVPLLARRLVEAIGQSHEHLPAALVDAMALMQRVRPPNAAVVLLELWDILAAQSRILALVGKKFPWAVEHATALALYPVCDSSVSQEVAHLVLALADKARPGDAPPVVIADIAACKDLVESKAKELPPPEVNAGPADLPGASVRPDRLRPSALAPVYRYPPTDVHRRATP